MCFSPTVTEMTETIFLKQWSRINWFFFYRWEAEQAANGSHISKQSLVIHWILSFQWYGFVPACSTLRGQRLAFVEVISGVIRVVLWCLIYLGGCRTGEYSEKVNIGPPAVRKTLNIHSHFANHKLTVLSIKFENYQFLKVLITFPRTWQMRWSPKTLETLAYSPPVRLIFIFLFFCSPGCRGLKWVSVPSSFQFLAKDVCFNELNSRRKMRIKCTQSGLLGWGNFNNLHCWVICECREWIPNVPPI